MALPQDHSENSSHQELENLLGSVEGVTSVRIWEKNGGIFARVTVCETFFMNSNDLLVECRKKLGINNSPQMILIEREEPQQRPSWVA